MKRSWHRRLLLLLSLSLYGEIGASQVPAVVEKTAKLHSGWKLVGEIVDAGQGRTLFPTMGYGVMFNDEAVGFLHESTWLCASAFSIINGKGSEVGHCVATDRDGDQLWASVESAGPAAESDTLGTYTILGGKGKFSKIKGAIVAKCSIVSQTHQLVCAHTASYHLTP